nr:helix-hairpin-helix domain-containing protein [Ardenticatena sp.]
MTYLLTPLLDDGIEHTNFFDGRLLTAAALETEQHAVHNHQRALGEAIGDGVAAGFFVTLMNNSASTPQVQVAAGLAVNRDGQTLCLPMSTTLTLHEPSPPATTSEETGLFHVCAPPSTDTLTPNSALFVLVISPAEGFRGQVALETSVPAGAPNGCGADKVVEGVMFRLVNLPLSMFTDDVEEQVQLATLMQSDTTADHSRLRNWVAHLLFGTPALLDIPRDPWDALDASSATPHGGAFAHLWETESRLKSCDVPLALIFWTPSGIQWVDNWAVRRPVARATSDHRRVLAEGMLDTLGALVARHFQEHVAWLLRPPTTTRTDFIKSLFRYLPAAAMLPFIVPEESQETPTAEHAVAPHTEAKKARIDAGMVGGASILDALESGHRLDWQAEIHQFRLRRQYAEKLQANLGGPKQRGFEPFAFFGNLLDPDQYQVIPGAVLHRLLHEGFQHPPIDLDKVESADDYNLYLVNENWQAVQNLEDVQFYAIIGHKYLPVLPDALVRRAVAVAVQTIKPTVNAAAADAPVENVEDIGPKRAELLKKHGIQTVRDLATAAPEEVARILNYRIETAIKFVREAQRLLEEQRLVGE